MTQKAFTKAEVKTLKQICVLFNANSITKSGISDMSQRKTNSIINYKDVFSENELKIIQMICLECTTAEMAEKLGLSVKRIETLRSDIFAKTKAKNLVGVVKFAIKNGIFSLK